MIDVSRVALAEWARQIARHCVGMLRFVMRSSISLRGVAGETPGCYVLPTCPLRLTCSLIILLVRFHRGPPAGSLGLAAGWATLSAGVARLALRDGCGWL